MRLSSCSALAQPRASRRPHIAADRRQPCRPALSFVVAVAGRRGPTLPRSCLIDAALTHRFQFDPATAESNMRISFYSALAQAKELPQGVLFLSFTVSPRVSPSLRDSLYLTPTRLLYVFPTQILGLCIIC